MEWTPKQQAVIDAVQKENPGLDIEGCFQRIRQGDLTAILLDTIVKMVFPEDPPPSLSWNSIDDHIQYAKEIGSNFVGRPGPKWTAFALAEEVERLRSLAKN